jgi:hypothetical protein
MLDPSFLEALYMARESEDALKGVLKDKGIKDTAKFAAVLHDDKLDWENWKKIYEGFGPMPANT